MKIKINVSSKLLRVLIFSLLLLPFFILLFKISYHRFAMFGCFDECFNYLTGYFLLEGKILYKEIFFHHQMLMPYLSYAIQFISHPESIYHLVLYHRMFIFFFAILLDLFLIYRFGKAGLGFVLLFEPTKFYFMGSLFLPESIVVYLQVYLFGLCWVKLTKKNLSSFDYIIAGFFTWAIVFLREPYVLSAIFMYIIILWGRKWEISRCVSLGIVFALSFLVLALTDLKSYIYQVLVVNFQPVLGRASASEIFGLEFLRTFFYPVYIFLAGKLNFLRHLLMGLSFIFLVSLSILTIRFKKLKLFAFTLIILGTSNGRYVLPGTTFYEAFHMLVWYGLFVMSTTLLLEMLFKAKGFRVVSRVLTILFLILFTYAISPSSFFQENIRVQEFYRNQEFKLEFDKYYINGEAIRLLSDPNDTLFVDLWDYLIYWQAGLRSSYKYTTYLGPAAVFPVFVDERLEMFRKNPPDFYYYACSGEQLFSPYLPDFRINDYVALYYVDRPSCLYVKKTKLNDISPESWEKLKILRFYLPQI